MKVLIIEDEQHWQELLSRTLAGLGDDVEPVVVADPQSAKQHIQDIPFDLIIVDLHLPITSTTPDEEAGQTGMTLLEEAKASEYNRWCAKLVLTGYPTTDRVSKALKQLGVFAFLVKDAFEPEGFLDSVRGALLDALIKQGEILRDRKYLLSLLFSDAHLLALQLSGPDRRQDYLPRDPVRFDAADFGRRCDELNIIFSPPLRREYRSRWRTEARSIGRGLYASLAQESTFVAGLSSSRNLPERGSDLWLCTRGPRASLDVPFELLYDGWEYLALSHPLYRQVVLAGPIASRKVEPFRLFFKKLVQEKKKLRILLVASNVGVRVDAVDQEVEVLSDFLRARLAQLGVDHEIEVLHSADSTYARAQDALRNSHFHIIHYAGHGRFDDKIAERSSLFFREDTSLKSMPASALKALLQESETRLLYLSCCLGARTAEGVGQGDFLGLVDGIVQADVPVVLGYRWVVSDKGAKEMALSFYETLFSTLCPEDALFQARRKLSTTRGRDDETWASPVLVVQNS